MKLAIVAYPELDDGDRLWIEGIRDLHDPQAARIPVHFTLVFPLDGLASDLDSDLRAVVRAEQPIPFAIRHAIAVPDTFSRLVHVFLVPDRGRTQIAELHDRLYAGRLRLHLRGDITYVPHMTVGATSDVAAAGRLASACDERARAVRGRIANLHLVDVGAARVRTITSHWLGDGGIAG
jgi:2'-5' RNA ligase